MVPEEAPASETDINLEVSFAEQAVNQKESSREKIQRSKGDDALLPVRNTLFRCHYQSIFFISFLFGKF